MKHNKDFEFIDGPLAGCRLENMSTMIPEPKGRYDIYIDHETFGLIVVRERGDRALIWNYARLFTPTGVAFKCVGRRYE